MRLLIVEDEEKFAQNLKKGLQVKGYAVDWLSDSEKALNRILMYQNDYDLIILDLMLPKIDGATILEKVREVNVKTPIIILTARHETEHRVAVLNKGADDYIVKPFSFEELIARINSVLRRPTETHLVVLRVNNLEMDVTGRVVRQNGQKVSLTFKEFALLERFMRQPGMLLSREDLFEHIWDFNSLKYSNVLDVHIKNLRKKLSYDTKAENLLETVRGVGYRLAAEA